MKRDEAVQPRHQRRPQNPNQGPGTGYRSPEDETRERKAQTAQIPVNSKEFQEWHRQASFQGLNDVGQAAPPLTNQARPGQEQRSQKRPGSGQARQK